MFTYFLLIVAALLYIAVAYFLVRRYIRSRNQGFIWLGIAFLLWPRLQIMLNIYREHLLGQYPSWISSIGMTPGAFFEVFQLAEFTVLPALLLVAIYYLGKPKFETRESLA